MESSSTADIDLEYKEGSCAGPVAVRRIAGIERSTATRLDPVYLRHLDLCNGGNPRKRYFPVPDNIKVIERFLCIIEGYRDDDVNGWYDVGVVYAQIFDRLDGHQVPIAALFGGDMLVLDDQGGPVPRVAVWDHERSDTRSPFLIPAADNFTSFLSLLYANDEDDEFDDNDEDDEI